MDVAIIAAIASVVSGLIGMGGIALQAQSKSRTDDRSVTSTEKTEREKLISDETKWIVGVVREQAAQAVTDLVTLQGLYQGSLSRIEALERQAEVDRAQIASLTAQVQGTA
jgi:hypothetical protein